MEAGDKTIAIRDAGTMKRLKLMRDGTYAEVVTLEMTIDPSEHIQEHLDLANAGTNLLAHALEHAGLGVGPVPGIVNNSAGAAAANTAAIQAALNTGLASLTVPGVVYINSTLSMPSNSELYIGSGVTLKLAPGSNCSMVRNSSYLGASLATVTITSTNNQATGVWTAHGKPVGSKQWLTIGGANQHEYNGTFYVKFTDGNSFVYTLETTPAATTATGTIKTYAADHDIKIWGPGSIDYDYVNNSGGGSSPAAHAVIFNRVGNARYEIRQNFNVLKYVVLFADCSGYSTGSLWFNTASDGVHIQGPSRGIANIGDLDGYCGDDMCSLTCGDYAAYKVSIGEIGHVKIGVIKGENSAVALLKITGGAGPKVRKVEVAGLQGSCVAEPIAIIEDTYGGATLTATYIEHLIVRNAQPWITSNSAAVIGVFGSVSGSTVERLQIENARPFGPMTGQTGLVWVQGLSSIRHLDINGADIEFASSSTGSVVRTTQTAVISTFAGTNIRYKPYSSSNALCSSISGTANGFSKIQLTNVEMIGNTGGYLLGLGGTYTTDAEITNVSSSTTNSPVTLTGSSAVVNLYSRNWKHSGSGAVYSVAGSTLNWAGDCDCSSTPGPAGAFRANGTMRVNAALVSGSVAGDTFYNTNTAWTSGSGTDKSGFYGYTGSAFTKVFGPA